jgi:N-acetylmuramoyl-L-alanine amidase
VPQATPDAPPADADSQPPNDASYRPLLLRAPAWTGLTVLIDPGHGGVDPGVQQNGVVEKELTLWLAREIVAAAQSAHGRAFLTRVGDQSVTREERWRAVSERQATAFISLHFNSSASPSNSGYRVVVNVSQGPTSGPRTGRSRGAAFESGRLADVLTSALDAAGFTGERLALPLATVPEVAIPAVHLEIAYLSNPEEAALWRNQTVLRAAAGAIWAGLARYRP